jgi:hypothetical protein
MEMPTLRAASIMFVPGFTLDSTPSMNTLIKLSALSAMICIDGLL